MNKFFDVRTPMMKPLWRRIAFTVFSVGWGLVELRNGNTMFALIFLAAGGHLIREFFLKYDEAEWDAEFAARAAEQAQRTAPSAPATDDPAPEDDEKR